SDGFIVKMREEEASTGRHLAERVDWIAIEASESSAWKTGIQALNHLATPVGIEAEDLNDIVFLADMQTKNGGNTASLRYQSDADGAIMVHVEEETSQDAETWHMIEDVGFLATNAGSHLLGEFDYA
ncbi:MAG: hypothetical protein AAGC92_16910, partial [Pseudomonadota bacterium]